MCTNKFQKMNTSELKNVFADIQRRGVYIDEYVLKDSFKDVVNKALDTEMGFGYVGEEGYKPDARVILQGKNPFIDSHAVSDDGMVNDIQATTDNISGIAEHNDERISALQPSVSSSRRWTQHFVHFQVTFPAINIFNIIILRHYLHVASLSEEEMKGIKVAACSLENMDSIEFKSIGDIDATGKGMVSTDLAKQDEIPENQYAVEKTKSKQESAQLLDQMNKIVHPASKIFEDKGVAGKIVVTVHKARDIEKKGLMGKADPYVVLTYGSQKEKSATMKNSQDPVWHVTGSFDVDEQVATSITFEVFDEDIGKDDFLGKAVVDIHEIFLAKEFVNKWIPLESCESGHILISARFIPLQNVNRPVGHVSVTVHKAKKIEKKNMLKKADPYVLVKLGKEEQKSQTVNNNQKPTWNFKVDFDVKEYSPRQLSLEVFDEDIGNDANIGNITLEMDTIMKKNKMENVWTKLENCKSGEVLLSTIFVPAPFVEDSKEDIEMEGISEDHNVKILEQKSLESVENKPSSLKEKSNYDNDFEFLNPVYCDDEFVVVEKKKNSWFMVNF